MNFIVITVFYSTLFLRPFLVISSSNIILIWLRLELGVFSFLPIINSRSQRSFSTAKYFLIQRIGSVIILASSLHRFIALSIRFIFIALILKLGIVPFHFWVPKIVSLLQTKEILILLVWQKIGPLFIIVSLPIFQSTIKVFIRLLRVSVGRILGLKQTQWRQIFTFSSIRHLGWIVIRRTVSFWLFFVYFITYAISLIQLFLFNNKLFRSSSSFFSTGINLFNLLILLSLAGLPPILGFLIKLLVLFYFINSPIISLIILIIISFSIIRIFFYLKIYFSLSLFSLASELSRNKLFLIRNILVFFSFPLLINF